jgi:phosphohistidine phosphatase SixA
MIKHIIAVRHADYGGIDKGLTHFGFQQAECIGRYAKMLNSDFRVVSSKEKRAVQTANTIMDVLSSLDYLCDERIFRDGSFSKKEIAEIERAHIMGEKSVLFVGHMPFIRDYASYASNVYGVELLDNFSKGEGFHIILDEKKIVRVSPNRMGILGGKK